MAKPCGWRILVKPREIEETTKGGIILIDSIRDTQAYAAAIAQVIEIGEDAYRDFDKFTTPWVSVGDWIMIGKFAGHSFKEDGEEFRILNDDEVIAIIDDPSSISA